jgi:acetyltransferase-like isoleucine patch superfamily enzyme
MNNSDKIVIENQLRKHHKLTITSMLRRWYILRRCKSVGKDVVIDPNVKLLRFPENVVIQNQVIIKEGVRICSTNSAASISIGEGSTIGYQTMIFSSKNISIGDNCLIAPFCYIIDSNHQIVRNKLINSQPLEARDIVLEHDIWLGTGVKVLSGVTIGAGAVVAAGSIVNQDIPPYQIFGGMPAKKIGERE